MAREDIAAALGRVDAVLRRRPEAGIHEDAPAMARWAGNTRVVTHHDNGMRFLTDMPGEMGGTGDQVSPGWLFRAGLASCAATSIALLAAQQDISLETLEVRAGSQSDARGMLGIVDADGSAVPAGPLALRLHVRVAAPGVPAARLRELVEEGYGRSPIPCAVRGGTQIALDIDIDTDER